MNLRSIPQLLMAALITMGSAAHLSSQSIEFISVEKLSDYIQTGTGTVTPRPFNPMQGSFPFSFRIDVEGDDLDLLDAPTFTAPAGSSYNLPDPPADGVNHGTLIFNSDGEWGRTFAFGIKGPTVSGYPSGTGPHPSGLDGVFANGEYTVTVGGEELTFQLGGDGNVDVYPNTPIAEVGGTWAGDGSNRLYVNINEAFTINSGTFANFGTAGYVSGINIFIGSNGNDVLEMLSLSSDLLGEGIGDDFLEYTFDPVSLVSGTEYFVEIEYFNLLSVQNVAELDGALAFAMFVSRTQFSIQAVPEPSTYAAIVGALVLGGVMFVRRRRLV